MIKESNNRLPTIDYSTNPLLLKRTRPIQPKTIYPFQFQPLPASTFNRGILQIVQQWLAQLQNGEMPRAARPLHLSPNEQSKLKNLLGFSDSAPVSVTVLDSSRNGKLSAGDTLIVQGGITGGEIARRVLSESDIAKLNNPEQAPHELVLNEAKWDKMADAGPVSYDFQQSCFCPVDYNRPMRIVEDRGRIVEATFSDNGEPVPIYIKDGLLTVKERFAQLAEAYSNGAEKIEVDYDTNLGFPRSVFIDQSSQMADEEVRYTISNASSSATSTK